MRDCKSSQYRLHTGGESPLHLNRFSMCWVPAVLCCAVLCCAVQCVGLSWLGLAWLVCCVMRFCTAAGESCVSFGATVIIGFTLQTDVCVAAGHALASHGHVQASCTTNTTFWRHALPVAHVQQQHMHCKAHTLPGRSALSSYSNAQLWVTRQHCACTCRHTCRFLLWWLTGFPFAAWAHYGWVTPFITALVAFLLLGTENIGIQIEEPFEVLPIESISAACVASVHDMMDRHSGKLTLHSAIPESLSSSGSTMHAGPLQSTFAASSTDVTNKHAVKQHSSQAGCKLVLAQLQVACDAMQRARRFWRS